MHIVFSADRRMIAGLHVAMQSLLESLDPQETEVQFDVFSDDLMLGDFDLLKTTLDRTRVGYRLTHRTVELERLEDFPQLHGSMATYYRLFAPEILQAERLLYVDADTLCKIDISPLYDSDLEGMPLALAPEASIHGCVDKRIPEELGEKAKGSYFNAGVMLVDVDRWRQQEITRRCLEYVSSRSPMFHDQSALNYVMHGNIHPFETVYNCRSNARENWPVLKKGGNGEGRLIHFVDFPKPWSPLGRWVHPMGKIWWNAYRKTAHFQTAEMTSLNSIESLNAQQRQGYKKAVKDKILFSAYDIGLLHSVKGMK